MSQFETKLYVPTFRVRYFAYNCLEIKLPGGKTLVVDPCLVKEGRFASGYDENDLEACDYVFVNHTHGDHVATLGKVYDRFHPLVLAHASVAFDMAQLYDIPYIQTIPFTPGDTFDFGDFKLEILHARHALNNMKRPSGREDGFNNVFAKPGGFKLTYSSELDKRVSDMGTMFNSNFLMTLSNNLRIGFFAGNPGMTAAEDCNMWKDMHPDIIFAHRAKYTVDYANCDYRL